MADFADHAAALETQDRERALREQRERSNADKVHNPTGCCKDCGDVINAARLSANPHAARCLHCQSAAERSRALHR